jgi:pSer/pThr/pTyr-binding forkhead associated (FHA) protein
MEIITGLLRFPFLALLVFFAWHLIVTLDRHSKQKMEFTTERRGFLLVESGELFLGADRGHKYFIPDHCSIGRNLDNFIVINDPYSSNFHTLIERKGKKHYIADMGSKNGTVLNDRIIEKTVRLKPGDIIRTGNAVFRFDIE